MFTVDTGVDADRAETNQTILNEDFLNNLTYFRDNHLTRTRRKRLTCSEMAVHILKFSSIIHNHSHIQTPKIGQIIL